MADHLTRVSTPIGAINCPSRRSGVFPCDQTVVNAGTPARVSKSDYACNGGSVYTDPFNPHGPFWSSCSPNDYCGPTSLDEGESPKAKQNFADKRQHATGVFYVGSLMKMAQVRDGTSKTLLLGEKHIPPSGDIGDNEMALCGDNHDISRWTDQTPVGDNDKATGTSYTRFGSSHPGSFGTAMCDGSVRFHDYAIDQSVWLAVGHRDDGGPNGGLD